MPGRVRTGGGLIALSLRSWRPVWSPPGSNPLARSVNITVPNGRWSRNISHGKMICDSVDLTLMISPRRLRYFYRGLDPNASGRYPLLPWLAGCSPTQTSLAGPPRRGFVAPLHEGGPPCLRQRGCRGPCHEVVCGWWCRPGGGLAGRVAARGRCDRRYAIFNYATQTLGGTVTVPRFQLTAP